MNVGVTINIAGNKPMNVYQWLEPILQSPSDAAYTINIP
jgi:hypothetical protein